MNYSILDYSQTCIKQPLKGNVISGLLKRWSLKKRVGGLSEVMKNKEFLTMMFLCLAAFVEISSLIF